MGCKLPAPKLTANAKPCILRVENMIGVMLCIHSTPAVRTADCTLPPNPHVIESIQVILHNTWLAVPDFYRENV